MSKEDYINYRIDRAHEALEDAKLLAENERWNTTVNRLYYASFYAIIALLIKNGIETRTHDGVRTQFGLQFVIAIALEKQNAASLHRHCEAKYVRLSINRNETAII